MLLLCTNVVHCALNLYTHVHYRGNCVHKSRLYCSYCVYVSNASFSLIKCDTTFLCLYFIQLNKKFEESPDKTAKVHISVEESGQPLKDVVLDTTLRGLFYDTTEPKGEANLASTSPVEEDRKGVGGSVG